MLIVERLAELNLNPLPEKYTAIQSPNGQVPIEKPDYMILQKAKGVSIADEENCFGILINRVEWFL